MYCLAAFWTKTYQQFGTTTEIQIFTGLIRCMSLVVAPLLPPEQNLDREHLFSLDPSIVVAQHGTSSIAGMHQHASWCQCLVVLGKTMLDQKLADGTTCLLVHWHRTCLDGFNFPLQVCWESHGSTLSTSWHLDQTVFGWPGFP